MSNYTLDDIYSDPDYLRFAKEDKQESISSTSGVLLEEGFLEIQRFCEKHDRVPSNNDDASFEEQKLATRLSAILADPNKVAQLLHLDEHNILDGILETKIGDIDTENLSIEDILSDDIFDAASDIFELKHVKPIAEIEQADFVAHRKPCQDFSNYKPLFDQVARDLELGNRKTLPFKNEQEIDVGNYFIHKGSIVYVASKGEETIKNGKRNARLRLIFDNGTEGNNLLRSLARELYKDDQGRRVTEFDAGPLFNNEEDTRGDQTGTIYVLKSLSEKPSIRQFDGFLHKIGVTSGSVEKRIADAENASTFLLAKVEIVSTYTLFGINRNKLESLLHKFFDSARADIEIEDRFGKPVKPREWFFVTPEAINEAILAIEDGSIPKKYYDVKKARIVEIEH